MKTKASLCLVAIAALPFLVGAGCPAGKYTGGGFISSAAGGKEKATFGFNLEGLDRDGDGQIDLVAVPDPACPDFCLDIWWLGKGQFDYDDHGAGVKFHFDCDESTALDPNGDFPDEFSAEIDFDTGDILRYGWYGTYTSRAGSGKCQVYVTSIGDDQGHSNESLQVDVYTGPYAGYHNAGTIGGGNTQWHPAE